MREDIKNLITRRRKQILVHSFLYYQMNTSVIPDHQFDQWCRELVDLQEKYPEEASKADYADAFKDFDGSTGFDLPYARPEIQTEGLILLDAVKTMENRKGGANVHLCQKVEVSQNQKRDPITQAS